MELNSNLDAVSAGSQRLKVLMISSDRNLFTEGSVVADRIKEYGELVDELHIVILALKSLGFKEKKIADNVWIYPTNSLTKLSYVHNASSLGKKLVKEKGFVRGRSLITAQDPFECGLAGLAVKKKWRIPLEVQMHIDPLFSEGFDRSLDKVRKKIGGKVISSADTIRVVADFIKNRLEKNFSLADKHVYTLPVYIDREQVESATLSFDVHARFGWRFVMLAVARLTPQKNLDMALEVLRQVRVRFSDTGLVIVGTGKDEARLKKLAKKLGVDKNVAFEGWQGDLGSYYKTSNVFIQTSLFEGYGMALVEAGLSGLPVVTTPVGIALELDHGKDAYIYPSGNVEMFVAGITDLLENNQKRENLKMNMKRALEQKLFSKEEYLEKLQSNWAKTAASISKS